MRRGGSGGGLRPVESVVSCAPAGRGHPSRYGREQAHLDRTRRAYGSGCCLRSTRVAAGSAWLSSLSVAAWLSNVILRGLRMVPGVDTWDGFRRSCCLGALGWRSVDGGGVGAVDQCEVWKADGAASARRRRLGDERLRRGLRPKERALPRDVAIVRRPVGADTKPPPAQSRTDLLDIS
jgi:hypothetical protein